MLKETSIESYKYDERLTDGDLSDLFGVTRAAARQWRLDPDVSMFRDKRSGEAKVVRTRELWSGKL